MDRDRNKSANPCIHELPGEALGQEFGKRAVQTATSTELEFPQERPQRSLVRPPGRRLVERIVLDPATRTGIADTQKISRNGNSAVRTGGEPVTPEFRVAGMTKGPTIWLNSPLPAKDTGLRIKKAEKQASASIKPGHQPVLTNEGHTSASRSSPESATRWARRKPGTGWPARSPDQPKPNRPTRSRNNPA